MQKSYSNYDILCYTSIEEDEMGFDIFEKGSNGFVNYTAIGAWMIVSVVIAIIGGIALYFTVFSKQNENKYQGFMSWLYEFFTFKKMVLESLLKVLYCIVAIYITISSLGLLSTSFLSFLCTLVFGNLFARLLFEFLLLLLTICKNTTEINDKLSKVKKEKEIKDSKDKDNKDKDNKEK